MITVQDIYKEVKAPQEVEKLQEPNMLGLIYKAVYMCLRILIDIRSNQVKMSQGVSLTPVKKNKVKVLNPVIKDTDKIKEV